MYYNNSLAAVVSLLPEVNDGCSVENTTFINID